MTSSLSAEIAWRDGVTPDLMAFETSEHDPQPPTRTLVWSNMQICRNGKLMGEALQISSTVLSPGLPSRLRWLTAPELAIMPLLIGGLWALRFKHRTKRHKETQTHCWMNQCYTDAWRKMPELVFGWSLNATLTCNNKVPKLNQTVADLHLHLSAWVYSC